MVRYPVYPLFYVLSGRQMLWEGRKEVWEIVVCVGGRGYAEREAWLEMKGEGACDKARGRCRRKCCVRARNQTLCSGVVTFGAPSFPEQPPFSQLRGFMDHVELSWWFLTRE